MDIKPNPFIAFFSSFVSFLIPGAVFLGALWALGLVIDYQLIAESLAFVGLSFNPANIYKNLMWVIGVIIVIISFVNVFLAMMKGAELYPDHLALHGKTVPLPLKNITQVTFEKKGLSSLFKAGTIHIHFSGEQGMYEIPVVKDVEIKAHAIEEAMQSSLPSRTRYTPSQNTVPRTSHTSLPEQKL